MNQPLHWLAHLGRLGQADLHPGSAAASDWLFDSLAIGPSHRVLELGCGTGQSLVRVAATSAARIDAVEYLPEMRRTAAWRLRLAGCHRRVRIHAGDFTAHLPFEDATFDRVYGESVVGFQPAGRVGSLLREVLRVLRPGGRFGMVEAFWAPGQDPAAVAAVCAAAIADFGLAPASPLAWTVDDWQAQFSAAGFVRIETVPVPETLPPPRMSFALRRSRGFTRLLKLRLRLSAAARRAEAEYLARLARHGGGGPQLEAWRLTAERDDDDR